MVLRKRHNEEDGPQWIAVTITNNLQEAHILAGKLKANDIPALIHQEAGATALGITLGNLGEIKFLVSPADLGRAERLLFTASHERIEASNDKAQIIWQDDGDGCSAVRRQRFWPVDRWGRHALARRAWAWIPFAQRHNRAALMAVNAVGNVYDERGKKLAGLRAKDRPGFDSVLEAIAGLSVCGRAASAGESTVIGVVATNGKLSKIGAQKVAQMAHDGIARAVNPALTMIDGNTIFALATVEYVLRLTLTPLFRVKISGVRIEHSIQCRKIRGKQTERRQ